MPLFNSFWKLFTKAIYDETIFYFSRNEDIWGVRREHLSVFSAIFGLKTVFQEASSSFRIFFEKCKNWYQGKELPSNVVIFTQNHQIRDL